MFVATKRWSAVEKLALAGTILVFAAVEGRASTADAFTFASLLFTLFMVPPFLRRTSSTGADLTASLSASAIYFAYSEHLISVINPTMKGPFALIFAAAMATLALAASSLRRDTTLARGLWVRSIIAFVLFPPLAFHGFAIITAWAIEGAFLVTSGELFSSQEVSSTGFALIGISSVVSLGRLAVDYSPQRILLSGYSVPVITSICALIVAGLVSKKGAPARSSAGGAAAVLSLAWLSAETIAAVNYRIGVVNRAQVAGFALSALWTLYGAAALAIGVRASIRWVRLGAAMLLGIVVVKLAFSDAWMLRTGLRVGVFIGVGAVLLACSVMYQRLRHLIVHGETHGDMATH
jgi:uncharacterized membrane protein